MSHSHPSSLIGLFASLALSACGVGAGATTSTSRVSAAAVDSLTSPADQGACIGALKDQVYAKTLTLEEYEARAKSECGVDFSAQSSEGGTGTKTPGEPEAPQSTPTPQELAFNACATALKDQVAAGTLSVNDFQQALVSQCGAAPAQAGAPDPAPTAAELAYSACVAAVKGEVIAGTLAINDYEAALASRCPPPPPAAK
jgi:hypothetical protein